MSRKTQRVCIACDKNQFKDYGKELIECRGCGLVVAKHIPTFDELTKLYQEAYFFGMEYSDYKVDRPALEKNFKKRIEFLDRYLHKDASVLEVGCAYGYFLNLIKDRVGWHKGYDVSEEGVDFAVNELSVNASTKDFLKENDVKQNSVDLVCMWDVMEHFGEPQKHIEKAAQLLKKGGVLCFTTGNVGSFVAKKRGVNWRMIHPPTHVYYFNKESAKQLLAKYGLEVKSVRHKATYRNTDSVFNQLIVNKKAKQKSAKVLETGHKVAKITGMSNFNFPLNLYDVMEVTAIKV